MSAYYANPNGYTILSFPVVMYPGYEIVKAIPLPVCDQQGDFVLCTVVHKVVQGFVRIWEYGNSSTAVVIKDGCELIRQCG